MKRLTNLLIATMLLTTPLGLAVSAERIAIVGAKVHTMSEQGTLQNATVLISDGKIQRILTETPALSGYTIIDAKGKVVTPGLFGAYTSLGLVEVGSSAGVVDRTSSATTLSNSGAAIDVAYAINSDTSLFDISRVEGITSAATTMSNTKQLFQGQGAIIGLGNKANPLIKAKAFIALAVDNHGADDIGGSRAVLWPMLEAVLAEASLSVGKSLDATMEWHGITSKADAKALQSVVSGKIPLLIDARRAADIRQVIALKSRNTKLDITILYATEGWRVANEIAQANIPVILDPESNLPYEFDQLAATMKNASRLHKAGVLVAIGMNTHNIRLIRQHAGNAVANGLPWIEGLKSITSNPAKIYGVDDKVGSLQEGMQADIVIWSGDPLQITESAEQVVINGNLINMESRQSKLRDRYLNREPTLPTGYTRP
jgi:imidazolonepropionase-like amidohydrolase